VIGEAAARARRGRIARWDDIVVVFVLVIWWWVRDVLREREKSWMGSEGGIEGRRG